MSDEKGARAQRKRLTRQNLIEVATGLFLARGFDDVSVADVAAAAQVSKMTVFNYFDTKEDLVLSQLDDQADQAARVVRGRAPEQSAVAALLEDFVGQVRQHDPSSGLCQDERFLAFRTLILTTRSLTVRLIERSAQGEDELARALAELPGASELPARLAANQLIGINRALVEHNFALATTGGDLAELTERAVTDARAAYGQVENGLAHTPFGIAAS